MGSTVPASPLLAFRGLPDPSFQPSKESRGRSVRLEVLKVCPELFPTLMEPGLTVETKPASPWEVSAGTWLTAGGAATTLAPTASAQQDIAIPATVIRVLSHPIRAALPRCAVRAGVLCIRTSRNRGQSYRRPQGPPRRSAAIDGEGRPVGPGNPASVSSDGIGPKGSWGSLSMHLRGASAHDHGEDGRAPGRTPSHFPPGFEGNGEDIPGRPRMAGDAGTQCLTFITIWICDFGHIFGVG